MVNGQVGTSATSSDKRSIPASKALSLTVSRDKMEAYVICDAGIDVSDPEQAVEEMFQFLAEKGIKEIKRDVLEAIARNAPVTSSFLVAKGTPAENGRNAEVVLNIEQDDKLAEMQESLQRVDYRSVRKIDNVTDGTVLARLEAETLGMDGQDVYGRKLRAKPGKKARLVGGKNVEISKDGLEARATCEGVARVVSGKLTVDPVYRVKGDLDLVVGNIDFIGDVEISGDVLPDFVVKAGGNIKVEGNTDKSSLFAKADVNIMGGLFGKEGMLVKAGHDANLNFAENAIVEAINDVRVKDSQMQCELRAGNIVYFTGEGVSCLGGRVVSSGGVDAMTLGSPHSDVRTIVQIQVDPRLRRLRSRWLSEMDETEDPKQLALLTARVSTIDKQIERQKTASIIVHDRIYPGVEIIIDDVRYRPASELTHVRFSLAREEKKILMLDI